MRALLQVFSCTTHTASGSIRRGAVVRPYARFSLAPVSISSLRNQCDRALTGEALAVVLRRRISSRHCGSR